MDDASSVVEVSRIGKPVTILGSNMYGGFHAVPTFVSVRGRTSLMLCSF